MPPSKFIYNSPSDAPRSVFRDDRIESGFISEVNDPKGLCKDVTDIGRWGNGDVEIGLSNLDELPYVIGLVRQSLDLQLGNGSGS